MKQVLIHLKERVMWSSSFTTMKWSEVKSLSRIQLWDPKDCSLPRSSLQGILQARVLEWVAISFSRGSSWSRDWTHISCIAGRFFTVWATREVPSVFRYYKHSFVREETEAYWLPNPGLYLPVQGLTYPPALHPQWNELHTSSLCYIQMKLEYLNYLVHY